MTTMLNCIKCDDNCLSCVDLSDKCTDWYNFFF